MFIEPYRDTHPVLVLKCITNKVANFKEGKTYLVKGKPMGTKKPYSVYTDFKIEDEDGDILTIDKCHVGTIFEIVRKKDYIF